MKHQIWSGNKKTAKRVLEWLNTKYGTGSYAYDPLAKHENRNHKTIINMKDIDDEEAEKVKDEVQLLLRSGPEQLTLNLDSSESDSESKE